MIKAAILSVVLAGMFSYLSLRSPEQFFRTNLGVLDASEPISFFIEDGEGVPGYVSSDRDLARMAFDAWSSESDGRLRFVEIDDSGSALVRVQWVAPNQQLFGETRRILVSGKPGAVVFVMPNVANLSEPLASGAAQDSLLRDTVVYLTCVHELGHAIGLPHTEEFDDIMYYFGYGGDLLEYFQRYRRSLETRADIAKHSGLSAGDVAMLRLLYGQ